MKGHVQEFINVDRQIYLSKCEICLGLHSANSIKQYKQRQQQQQQQNIHPKHNKY